MFVTAQVEGIGAVRNVTLQEGMGKGTLALTLFPQMHTCMEPDNENPPRQIFQFKDSLRLTVMPK